MGSLVLGLIARTNWQWRARLADRAMGERRSPVAAEVDQEPPDAVGYRANGRTRGLERMAPCS